MIEMAGVIGRGISIVVLLSMCAGCWYSGRGDYGIVLGPVVYETYDVVGVVTGMDTYRTPITGARVSVVSETDRFKPVVTGLEGRFHLDVEREPHP